MRRDLAGKVLHEHRVRKSKVRYVFFLLLFDNRIFRFTTGKALQFDCGSNESGMKLQVSFLP